MDVDWWARSFGLAGLAIGGLGFALSSLQWWSGQRRRLEVMAFVEQFWPARHKAEVVPLEKREYSGIRIHLVNQGRSIAIDSVGFVDRSDGQRYVIYGPDELPAHLQPHDTRDVRGNPGEEWRAALSNGHSFIPYAEDKEGRLYRGGYDERFHQQAKALVAQYDADVTRP